MKNNRGRPIQEAPKDLDKANAQQRCYYKLREIITRRRREIYQLHIQLKVCTYCALPLAEDNNQRKCRSGEGCRA